jgi:hypothetical protein
MGGYPAALNADQYIKMKGIRFSYANVDNKADIYNALL